MAVPTAHDDPPPMQRPPPLHILTNETQECDGLIKTMTKYQADSKEVVNGGGGKTPLSFTKSDVHDVVQKAKRYEVLIGNMITNLEKM